ALADFDGDGRIDVIVNVMDSGPALLQNVVEKPGNWISIKLVGGKSSPRDAVGSVVFAKTGNLTQRADLISGASYASQSQQVIHFGLGSATSIDELKILWPDGATELINSVKANTAVTIVQGKGIVSNK
ncbi:MAG: ASPIC/UnbV domain-containing protein, partial [Acidobacteriota bacterium]|nr:ASPIC/UnbV domain-containing protein [Acidobacteriota bacterium]